MRKASYLFIYVFLFSLLVNGSACGSDNDETNPPKTPDGENPEPPVGLQAYMLTTTDTRTYDLKESTVEFESQASMSPKNILLSPQQTGIRSGAHWFVSLLPKTDETGRPDSLP